MPAKLPQYVYQNRDGYLVRLRKTVKGRRFNRSQAAPDLPTAKKLVAKFQAEYRDFLLSVDDEPRRRHPAPAMPTFREAISQYYREVIQRRDRRTQNKWNVIERYLDQTEAALVDEMGEDGYFLDRPLDRLEPGDFNRYREVRRASCSSYNTVHWDLMMLSGLFSHAQKSWNLGSLANPIKSINTRPQENPRETRVTPEDFQRLIEAGRCHSYKGNDARSRKNELEALLTVLYKTGLRIGEVLQLTWSDLTHLDIPDTETLMREGKVPTIRLRAETTKDKQRRFVPLSPETHAALRAHYLLRSPTDENQRVFTYKDSESFHSVFRSLRRRAGVDRNILVHSFRHEFISTSGEDGWADADRKLFSGHKTHSMLDRYTHVEAHNAGLRLFYRPNRGEH